MGTVKRGGMIEEWPGKPGSWGRTVRSAVLELKRVAVATRDVGHLGVAVGYHQKMTS